MPGRDRTGPWGNGAGTGWGMGPCGVEAGRGRGGVNRAAAGRCRGLGRGFGRGFGATLSERGRRGFAAGRGPGFAAPYADTPVGLRIDAEMNRLQSLRVRLEQELKGVQARLDELQQPADSAPADPVEDAPGSAGTLR